MCRTGQGRAGQVRGRATQHMCKVGQGRQRQGKTRLKHHAQTGQPSQKCFHSRSRWKGWETDRREGSGRCGRGFPAHSAACRRVIQDPRLLLLHLNLHTRTHTHITCNPKQRHVTVHSHEPHANSSSMDLTLPLHARGRLHMRDLTCNFCRCISKEVSETWSALTARGSRTTPRNAHTHEVGETDQKPESSVTLLSLDKD